MLTRLKIFENSSVLQTKMTRRTKVQNMNLSQNTTNICLGPPKKEKQRIKVAQLIALKQACIQI